MSIQWGGGHVLNSTRRVIYDVNIIMRVYKVIPTCKHLLRNQQQRRKPGFPSEFLFPAAPFVQEQDAQEETTRWLRTNQPPSSRLIVLGNDARQRVCESKQLDNVRKYSQVRSTKVIRSKHSNNTV